MKDLVLGIQVPFSLRNLAADTYWLQNTGGGGSSIVKVLGDVPPARVYLFGLLV